MLRVLWIVLVASTAGPAFAQSRITAEGGPMIPLGDFNDWANVSWWAGLRGELRGVDDTGKPKSLSTYLRAAYSDMSFDPGFEEFYERTTSDDGDCSFFMGSAGIRTYSGSTPLFVQVGAGYLRFDPPDDDAGMDGIVFEGGIGFSLPFKMIHGEAVALIHEALLNTGSGLGDADLPFMTVAAGISIPL